MNNVHAEDTRNTIAIREGTRDQENVAKKLLATVLVKSISNLILPPVLLEFTLK